MPFLLLFSREVVSNSWDPMDCCMPGSLSFTIFQSLLRFMITELVMLSNLSSSISPFSFCLQSFPAPGSFPMSWLLVLDGQSIAGSTSAAILLMNIQSWFPLELTGLISLQSKRLSESSPTPQFKSINSCVLSFLYGPNLISILDYWKKHSFDYMDICWQSNVSAF